MRRHEQLSSLVFLLAGLWIVSEALRLGIGSARVPGVGFMSFWGGVLLVVLSALNLLRATFLGYGADKVLGSGYFSEGLFRHIVPTMLALLAYALILKTLGFVASTFVLMVTLFIIAKPDRWRASLLAAFVATAASHLLFQELIKSQLPRGPWGF